MFKNLLFFVSLFSIFSSFSFGSHSQDEAIYLRHIEKGLTYAQYDGHVNPEEYTHIREELTQLFVEIYQTEKAYPDMVQCLTAQDSLFYAYQVIAKELYHQLHEKPRENFEFFRFPNKKLSINKTEFFSKYSGLTSSLDEVGRDFEEAINKYELEMEEGFLKHSRGEKTEDVEASDHDDDDVQEPFSVNDTNPDVSKELLSVNFTLETYLPFDSTLFVFLNGKSVSINSTSNGEEHQYNDKLNKIFMEIFESLPLSKENVKACIESLIKNAPRTKFGIINQIFLPKDTLNETMYVSSPGGFYNKGTGKRFEQIFNEFQQNRREASFRTFRNFQARVIAGSLFKDPRIKIFRYTLIPKEDQTHYEAFVRKSIRELISH